MVSRAFTAIILAFNSVMGLLIFLASQVLLLDLVGYQVTHVGTSIGYNFYNPISPGGTAIPMSIATLLPNYPLYMFILALIVNLYFAIKLRRMKS